MFGTWLPLKDLITDKKELDKLADQLLKQDPKAFLPSTYTPAQIEGFKKQRALLAEAYKSPNSAVIELVGGGRFSTSLDKPASRGVISINTADIYAEPTVDFNVFK